MSEKRDGLRVGVIVNGFFPFDKAGVPQYIDRVSKRMVSTSLVDVHCIVTGNKRNTTSRNGYLVHYIPALSFLPGILKSTIGFAISLLIFGPRIIRETRIDILHGHTSFFGGIQAMILGFLTHRPVVLTLHGSDRQGPLTRVIGKSNIIVVQRQQLRNRLIKKGVMEHKIRLAPNCIDIDNLGPAEKKSDQTRILFVGRLGQFRNPEVFIQAICEVSNSDTNFSAYLVGDGPLRPKLEEMVITYQLGSTVEVTGWVDSPFDGFGIGDVFVACSYIENYSSTSLLEAMALGMAVVATDVGETRDLIISEKNGLLALPNPQSIAIGIVQLLVNSSLRELIGVEAAKLVRNRYSLPQLISWHMKWYKEVLVPS